MDDKKYYDEIFQNWLDKITTRETKKLGRHLKSIQRKLIVEIEDFGKDLIKCRPNK